MTGPLDGLRVFDLTRVMAGPTCTQLLGDLGAEVIKIERPGVGDDTRKFGPPFLKDAAGNDTTESAYYLSANRNKRSITIDLAEGDGQGLARRLIAHCDILVENFRVGALAKYGLSYEHLKADFPQLIYCSLTGFGQTGPYASRPGYDIVTQAMGGIMSVTGEARGEPQKVGAPIADIMAGMYAAIAVLAAARHQAVTGEGEYIDLGLLDTQVAWLANQGMNYLISGELPARLGNAHPNIVPYQVFETADGYVVIAVANDTQFQRFCESTGVGELASEERFRTNAARVRNRAALIARLEPILAQHPTQYWLDRLDRLNVVCGPINTLDQVFAHPQLRHRDMVIDMPHALAGRNPVKLIGNPIKYANNPIAYRYPPPTLGQHTEEVLKELLDMGEEELEGLRRRGVI
jgi:crotonobetainyl-CoA:carnitine CoA-transferase CaiB-like acyl-CoA transferase